MSSDRAKRVPDQAQSKDILKAKKSNLNQNNMQMLQSINNEQSEYIKKVEEEKMKYKEGYLKYK